MFVIAPLTDPDSTSNDGWVLQVMPVPGGVSRGDGATFETGESLLDFLDLIEDSSASARIAWQALVRARTGFAVRASYELWNGLLPKIKLVHGESL